MILMNRIKQLRNEKQISMKEAAHALGIPYTTYVGYEKGDREPNSEMLIKIASFFSVSVDYLICRSDDRKTAPHIGGIVSSLSADAIEIAKLYDQLDAGDQGEVRGTIKTLLRAEKYKKNAEGTA